MGDVRSDQHLAAAPKPVIVEQFGEGRDGTVVALARDGTMLALAILCRETSEAHQCSERTEKLRRP